MTDTAERYSLWVEYTDRGEVVRDHFGNRNEAILNARKYWLTVTGLFRAFVRDAEQGEAVVYDRIRDGDDAKGPREVYGPDAQHDD